MISYKGVLLSPEIERDGVYLLNARLDDERVNFGRIHP